MRLFFRPIDVVLLAGTFLAASISSVGVASPQASSQEDLRSPFETLSQIVQADSIRIQDEWEGYGPFSPISAQEAGHIPSRDKNIYPVRQDLSLKIGA